MKVIKICMNWSYEEEKVINVKMIKIKVKKFKAIKIKMRKIQTDQYQIDELENYNQCDLGLTNVMQFKLINVIKIIKNAFRLY